MLTEFHIGVDDTDSETKGCTTYTAAVLFEELSRKNFRPKDFPWLVRLNPNIPWKTRGNGALSIHVTGDEDSFEELAQTTIDVVRRTSDLSADRTDPAIALLKGPIPSSLREFSSRALHDVISVKEAEKTAETSNVDITLLKGERGIVGSLAAIGAGLDRVDQTFEIIAYRSREFLGKPRQVDHDSIREMDRKYRAYTFHNIDHETGRILVCPHGPDPVLLGIRGARPSLLLKALNMVRILEPLERVMIFRTNQGTNAHFKLCMISDLRPYQSVQLNGQVETIPKILQGGHVLFVMTGTTGSVDCLAFKPSGPVNKIARQLLPGDKLVVSGGIRLRENGIPSLNLEKLEIVELSHAYREENPSCSTCGGRCESMGRGQGLRCKRCGQRSTNRAKTQIMVARKLEVGSYIPPARARRHLTRPNIAVYSSREEIFSSGSTDFESLLKVRQLGSVA